MALLGGRVHRERTDRPANRRHGHPASILLGMAWAIVGNVRCLKEFCQQVCGRGAPSKSRRCPVEVSRGAPAGAPPSDPTPIVSSDGNAEYILCGRIHMTLCSRVSVVIPAYNEVGQITATIRDAQSYFESRNLAYEIVVSADGTDGTREAVAAMARGDSRNRRDRRPAPARQGPRHSARQSRGPPAISSASWMLTTRRRCEEFDELRPPARAGLRHGDRIARIAWRRGSSAVSRCTAGSARGGSRLFMHAVRRPSGISGTPSAGSSSSAPRSPGDLFSRQRIDGYMFDVEMPAPRQQGGLPDRPGARPLAGRRRQPAPIGGGQRDKRHRHFPDPVRHACRHRRARARCRVLLARNRPVTGRTAANQLESGHRNISSLNGQERTATHGCRFCHVLPDPRDRVRRSNHGHPHRREQLPDARVERAVWR